MNILKQCAICGLKTVEGTYNTKQQYVCRTCFNTYPNLYVDNFKIENSKVVSEDPLASKTEEDQRAECIQYAYTLFDQKLAKRSYSLFSNYRKKGYSWIGMIRALEWFFVVKENDIAKAKNSVGIIPYVYNDAQKYYETLNRLIERRYKKQVLPEKEKEEIVVEVSPKKEKDHLIDLGGL